MPRGRPKGSKNKPKNIPVVSIPVNNPPANTPIPKINFCYVSDERDNIRDYLQYQGIENPKPSQIDAVLKHKGTEPYLAALRAI